MDIPSALEHTHIYTYKYMAICMLFLEVFGLLWVRILVLLAVEKLRHQLSIFFTYLYENHPFNHHVVLIVLSAHLFQTSIFDNVFYNVSNKISCLFVSHLSCLFFHCLFSFHNNLPNMSPFHNPTCFLLDVVSSCFVWLLLVSVFEIHWFGSTWGVQQNCF